MKELAQENEILRTAFLENAKKEQKAKTLGEKEERETKETQIEE